jgi:hypothetical protein
VTIVLDRGLTMSVGDRRAEVIDAADAVLPAAYGPGATDLIAVPDGTLEARDRFHWADRARKLLPTQEQTGEAVQFVVRRALARTTGPVFVLSDQAIADDPRIVPIAPAKPLANVAITRFAVRETPSPQAMVTVANFSDRERALLRVRSGERTVVERQIDLPRTSGGESKFFIDLPSLEAAAVAEIEVADDIPIDNVATAKRQRSFPTIEIRAAVPEEVRRVVDAYSRARPAGEGSGRIAIIVDDAVPGDVPVAIIASSSSNGGAGAVTVAAHPVSAGVDWADAKLQATGSPPGHGWRTVVSVADRPAIAVRESPHRQVWIGLDAPDFARTPEFVIFWTNVFDWLAGGDTDPAQQWVAATVPPIRIPPPASTDWRNKLTALKLAQRVRTDVTSAVLLASVICLMLAAVAWPGRSLTAFSAARTV